MRPVCIRVIMRLEHPGRHFNIPTQKGTVSMKQIKIGGLLPASQIGLGCGRFGGRPLELGEELIRTCLEVGINFFDLADIYMGGASEEAFGKILTPSLRDQMVIQSKCSVHNGHYDLSKEHILEAVNTSLKRLHTDHLDSLLLHRADTLMEPEEVAEAFEELHVQGKVRYFGVSNFKPLTMELLQRAVPHKLIANQLQFSILHTGMIDAGFHMNMTTERSVQHDDSMLEYARLNGITIQAWSPFQYGWFEGPYLDNPKFPELNRVIDEIGEQHGIPNTAVAAAWMLRHPVGILPLCGTSNPGRIRDIAKGGDVVLTRKEWYDIYKADGNDLP